MKKGFLLILTIIPFFSIGQNQYYPNNKHNNTWIFGFGSWGNAFMTFDSNKIQIKKIKPTKLSMSYCTSIMSDTDGNLLFFTNGVSIMNKDFKIIKNGNRINPGPFMELYNWTEDGLPIIQGSLALSFPNNDSIFQLLHLDAWVVSVNNMLYHYSPLYYSTINMKMNSGLGEILKLNTPVNNDSVSSGGLTACRHANGRDWWLLMKQPYKPMYNTYLATQENIKFLYTQEAMVPDNKRQEPFGQNMFTSDGTKFISVSAPELHKPAYFDVYDFDRCSGSISNHQRIQFEDSLYHIVVGGAVSPNSRYLYVSRYDYILQFDLEANDILASMDTVAKYDGFKSPVTGCPTTFFLSQLAPDGKIYISVGPCATEYLTVINEPNKKGKDCDIQQHAIYLEVNNSWEVPNSPNYKLGALKGSGCDTLVMVGNKEISNNYFFNLFPNPATDEININLSFSDHDVNSKTEIVIIDISGAVIQKHSIPNFEYLATLDISKLPSGVYGVQLRQPQQAGDKIFATQKLVVVR